MPYLTMEDQTAMDQMAIRGFYTFTIFIILLGASITLLVMSQKESDENKASKQAIMGIGLFTLAFVQIFIGATS